MNRRTLLKAAAGPALIRGGARAASSSRPNILIIITDHLFPEALRCRIGDRYIKTLHMDSLAANGMFFARAYCANPPCMPSRTSMFTGRYPAETGIEINNTGGRFSPGWMEAGRGRARSAKVPVQGHDLPACRLRDGLFRQVAPALRRRSK